MSSLTSIGVNKNKKSFAPKKRKERRPPAVTQPLLPSSFASDQTETSEIKYAHLVREEKESGQPLPSIHPSTPVNHGIPHIPPVSIKPHVSSTHIPLPTVHPSHFPQNFEPPVTAPSPGAVLPKQEPLTEEELAINAFSRRRRQRSSISATTGNTASQTPVVPPTSVPFAAPSTASEDHVKIKQLSRATPAFPTTPIDAPSPIAPIERPECNFENEDFAPQLKIERMTPEVRVKVAQGEATPSYPTNQPSVTKPSPSTPIKQKGKLPQKRTSEAPSFNPKTPKPDMEEQDSQTAALLAAAATVNEMDDLGQNDYFDEDHDTYDGQNSGNRQMLDRNEESHDETQEVDIGNTDNDPLSEPKTGSKRKQPAKPAARKRQRKTTAAVLQQEEEEADTVASSSQDVVSGLPSARRAKARASQAIANTDYLFSEDEESTDEEEEEEEEEDSAVVHKPIKKPRQPKQPKEPKQPRQPKEPKQPKDKGKGKATPKPISKSAPVSISIGFPGQNNQTSNGDHASETSEGESETRLIKGRKRKTGVSIDKPDPYAYRQVKNMRTLDDVTYDPSVKANVDNTMTSFTRDIDGVVSKTFKEMEVLREAKEKKEAEKKNMSAEELDALRKKEEAEEAQAARQKEEEKERREAERLRREAEGQVLTESSNALQVRIVNGEIVLDTDTLTVERSAPESVVNDGMLEVVEENSLTRKVNSHTYGRRQQSARWDDLETEQFYDCLAQFGTDFEMIAMMMPGRTRSQIRLKYNREERLRPNKVTEYMIKKRKPIDIDKYKEMAGIDTLEAVPEDFHEMRLG
ncbi:hypothetical protein BD560DRAFT_397344 [Blakeslea trispora]|nr:hypothetical protein BD560DRAFT_397344 [Blakeslea trispora]